MKKILIILIVVIVIFFLIQFMKKDPSSSEDEDKIREDFPQTSPMNVLYSDANGNLSSTNDLGLQNLTVSGSSQFQGVVISDTNLSGPDGKTRITKEGITFGGTDGSNNGRELNSAQISAGKHDANSLCIIGMSSDAGSANRRITMWSEGGAKIYGGLNVTNNLTSGSLNSGNTSVGTLSAGTTTVGGLTASSISTNGTLSIPEYSDVKSTLKDLYAKIDAISTRMGTAEGNITGLKNKFDGYTIKPICVDSAAGPYRSYVNYDTTECGNNGWTKSFSGSILVPTR